MAVLDVFIPCYRYGHYLEDCVCSVLAQSQDDIRILIIDDASPDESADVARELARGNPRIEVIVHSSNKGHILTYNEGIEWAKSPYFLLLSADDMLAPGAVERSIEFLEAHGDVVLTYGRCFELLPRQQMPSCVETAGSHRWHILDGHSFVGEQCRAAKNLVSTPTAIGRTAVQKKIGGYCKDLPHSGDLEMWLRYAAHGSVARTSAVQGFYRVHENSMSQDYSKSIIADYLQRRRAFDLFFTNHGAMIADSQGLHTLAVTQLAEQAFWTAVAQFARGNAETGRALLNFGLDLKPSMRFAPPVISLLRTGRADLKILSSLAALYLSLGRSLNGSNRYRA